MAKDRRHEAIEIVGQLVYAGPKNRAAEDLPADVCARIGSPKEIPGARNSFLAGACELGHGISAGVPPEGIGAEGMFPAGNGTPLRGKATECAGHRNSLRLLSPA